MGFLMGAQNSQSVLSMSCFYLWCTRHSFVDFSAGAMVTTRKRNVCPKVEQKQASTSAPTAKRTKKSAKNLLSAFDSVTHDSADESDISEDCAESEDDTVYEIDEVLDERVDDELGEVVLVKWVGFEEQTWEPLKAIPKVAYNRFRKKKDQEQTKAEIKRVCVICQEEEQGGRFCESCQKPVHHMCSNEMVHELGLEERQDICFCSQICYKRLNLRQHEASGQPPGAGMSKKKEKKDTSGLTPAVGMSKEKDTSKVKASNGTVVTTEKMANMSAKKKKRATECSIQIDEVVGKSVAFAPSVEDWLPINKYEGVGSTFLVGVISRQKKMGMAKLSADYMKSSGPTHDFRRQVTSTLSLEKKWMKV